MSFKKKKKRNKSSKLKELQRARQDPSFGTSMSYKIKNIKQRLVEEEGNSHNRDRLKEKTSSLWKDTSLKDLSSMEPNAETEGELSLEDFEEGTSLGII